MKCPNCGQQNIDSANYCSNCGHLIKTIENEVEKNNRSSANQSGGKARPHSILIIISFLVLIIIVVLIYLFPKIRILRSENSSTAIQNQSDTIYSLDREINPIAPENTNPLAPEISNPLLIETNTNENTDNNHEAYEGYLGDLKYRVENGLVTITESRCIHPSIEVPSTIDGYPVTSIGRRAFNDCTEMTSITLPPGIISIEDSAFGLTHITSIKLNEGLKKIGRYAFAFSHLEKVEFPVGLEEIGDKAFFDTHLQSVILPEGLISIGDDSFNSMYPMGTKCAISSVSFPSTLKRIGDHAFEQCENLQQVTLPKHLEFIGEDVFSNNTIIN